ncbi:DUF6168 family protein [Pontimicrobium sp. MEBiC06410]
MIKNSFKYCLLLITTAVVVFLSHNYALSSLGKLLRFALLDIYVFHALASLFICISLMFLSKTEKWANQIGFIYIFSFVTKLLFFGAVFKDSIFEIENLTKIESFSLLIPVFIFLFFEVYIISRILNPK